MATHSIGTAGDFSTPQLWYDDIPATLIEQRIGQLKNQEFVFTGSATALVASARVTTASFNIILECASGASFKNNANVRTNALRYNASNGAGLKCEDASVITFSGTANHFTIRNIQILQAATALASFDIIKGLAGDTSTNRVIKDCIVEQTGSDTNDCMFLTGQNTVINCVAIHGGNNPDTCIKLADVAAGYVLTIVGCTVVRPSNLSSAGIGIFNKYAGNTLNGQNNAIFGFATHASQWTSVVYNGTSFSDVGSGLPDPSPDHNVYSLTYGSQFEQTSSASGTHDFRTKSGGLENTGLYDGTNSPQDISGFTRNNAPEIGAWELGTSPVVSVPPAILKYSGISIAGTGSNVAISATALHVMDAVIIATGAATVVGAN